MPCSICYFSIVCNGTKVDFRKKTYGYISYKMVDSTFCIKLRYKKYIASKQLLYSIVFYIKYITSYSTKYVYLFFTIY